MNVWGITHRGMVREQNQDAFACRTLPDGRIIALVCDGMGGARAGNIASTMAVELFMEEFLSRKEDESDRVRMERAASRANDEVFHRSNVDMECSGMGTTLVAALAGEEEALILNEGGSRAYHISEESGISQVTRDHSLVEDLVERGELTRDQARVHPHKNLITRALGAEPELAALAVQYLRVYALLSPLTTIIFASDNYLRICGRVRYSMILNVVTALLNIVLDFLFLVVFRWGVAAAAAASCLSIALGTVLGFLPFVMGRLPLRFVRGTISARQLGNILANGSSEFFSSIAGSVMMVILNSVLLRLSGSMAVAAFSIVMYVDSIVGSLLFGMADSIQPAISYNYGARRRDRMLALEKRVLLTGAAVSLAALLWMQLGGKYVIPLQGDDPALLEMSLRAMRLFSLSYLLGWAGTCLSSFFTALNRPGRSLILAFSKTLVFPLACLAVLPAALGLDGVWLTAPAAGVLTAALAVWFLIAVLRQERAQDRQEGEGTPQA